jgi:hypothetical protein
MVGPAGRTEAAAWHAHIRTLSVDRRMVPSAPWVCFSRDMHFTLVKQGVHPSACIGALSASSLSGQAPAIQATHISALVYLWH